MAEGFEIIECFVQGKLDEPDACEDEVIVTDSFIMMMDGATDKTGVRYRGMAGALCGQGLK